MPHHQIIGIIGFVAIAQCWALAVVLYRAGNTGSIARTLALLLIVEGVTLATSSLSFWALDLPESFDAAHPLLAQIVFILHTLFDSAMLALYPAFLAVALQTKLTRPFGSKRARIAMAGISIVLFISVQVSSKEISATLLYLSLSLLFSYALVASIHAWSVAKAGTARTRAGIFALAFGLRDVCWGFVYAVCIWEIWAGTYFELTITTLHMVVNLVYALGTLIAVPLIAYGILLTQLFDIDLRIKWTIKQSTLAGIFVAIIFLISEGASQFLSAELGNIAGLLAAAVVMFFLAPLQRFADRVASAAMPNTQNTPEYAAFRKLQVYEAAVDEALQEGGISQKERSLLIRLRDSLGISETDAVAIELELQTVQQV